MKFIMGKFEKEIKEPLMNRTKRLVKIIKNSFFGKYEERGLLFSISDVKIIKKKE